MILWVEPSDEGHVGVLSLEMQSWQQKENVAPVTSQFLQGYDPGKEGQLILVTDARDRHVVSVNAEVFVHGDTNTWGTDTQEGSNIQVSIG